MKKMKSMLQNQKGLTLIELLAVIVILAIIAAIAVPSVGNIINNQKDKAILASASNILSGAKLAHAEGACGGDECTKTEIEAYVDGESGSAYTVTKMASDWSITYDQFSNIKNAKYKTGLTGTSSTTTTQSNLNALMQK